MKTVTTWSLLVTTLIFFYCEAQLSLREIAEQVNANPKATWKANPDVQDHPAFHRSCVLEETEDVKNLYDGFKTEYVPHEIGESELPESFDGRKQWPSCKSLGIIRNQASCGSCWAFGAVEAMSDRTCIATNGSLPVFLSAEDVVDCCSYCGSGCFGGYPSIAWLYWVRSGIVSGGLYGSKNCCKPYSFPPCDFNKTTPPPPCSGNGPTPLCKNQCQTTYNVSYEKDKYYGKTSYRVESSETEIMAEIMKYGPVESGFTVYSDFPAYTSGVYRHLYGNELSRHAIRILGWGVENGEKYWLVANSWGPAWGESGYVKFLRGVNECGIESDVVAGRYN